MTKAANRFAALAGFLDASDENRDRAPELGEAEKMQSLRAALVDGESSGEAEPGTFERMRAAIRAAVRRSQ
jgi:hypothetical protein